MHIIKHEGIPVYWINLNRSKGRAANMLSRFDETGIKSIRVRAVDGADQEDLIHNVRFSEDHSRWSHYGFRTRAIPALDTEHACTASHIIAIHQAYYDLCEIAVIIEDDVSFSANYCSDLISLIRTMPSSCDIVQLCCVGPLHAFSILSDLSDVGENLIRRRDLFSRINHPQVRACFGTQGYFLNRRAMKRIVDFFIQDSKICLPYPRDIKEGKCGALADELIYYFGGGGGLYDYVAASPLVFHDEIDSEIKRDSKWT